MVTKRKQASIVLTARILEAHVLPEGRVSKLVLGNVNIRSVFACFMLGTCQIASIASVEYIATSVELFSRNGNSTMSTIS